jgi:protein O-mannosyl-transferase
MPRKFVVLLLAAVALATYWNALDAPFVWDDNVAIATNNSIHDIVGSLNPPIETPVAGRPVVNLSFALNYAYGGLDPRGYHVVNLAIHIVCALLLFAVVRRTLARQRPAAADARLDAIALASALLWMVHPLLSETIDYATERSESLMALFFLLTLYASIRARSRRRTSPKWTFIAVASCAAGMATKESMVTAPVAVVLKGLYLGLAATWLELAAVIWHWPRSTVGVAVSPITYFFNQAQIITRYLWLTVWPQSLVVDYGLPRALHLSDVIVPGAFIVALLAATIVALVRWPAAGFLGAMFFLTLAPTSSVVPILSEVGAERRMYLPLAALSILVVLGTTRGIDAIAGPAKGGRNRGWSWAGAALAVIVAALAIRTSYRNRDYDSPIALWQSAVDRRPNGRARFALANQLMDAGRHDEATAQLRLAVADYPDARAGLGTELLLQGKLEEGISVLNGFVQAAPALSNRAPARGLLAQAHRAIAERELSRGNAALAAAEARASVELDASNADAHNVLGAALASQGNLAAAIPEFRAALRYNPTHETALKNLAKATALYGRSNSSNAIGR